MDGAEQVKLFGEPIDVHAEIVKMEGLSGHADKNGLIDWINGFEQKPAKVFVVHGENTVAASFAQCLKDDYGFDTYAPYSGTEFDLGTGRLLKEAAPVPIVRKASIVSDVYSRLKAAGERLLAVIEQSRGMSNKDMAKFADQINSLCDKWLK